MARTNTVARAINEVSLATWFGGVLMGRLALPRAGDGEERVATEAAVWRAWQPVQLAAIAAQVGSGAVLTLTNRRRLVGQHGVARLSAARTAAMLAALAATAASARAGRSVQESAERGDGQSRHERERALRLTQTATAALTGALVVLDARMGEQQRPQAVAEGLARRLRPRRAA